MNSRRSTRFLRLLPLLAIAVASCVPPPADLVIYPRALYMRVSFVNADPRDINLNQPVEVALVVVYHKPLVEVLEGTTAKDWFGKEHEFRRNHPA